MSLADWLRSGKRQSPPRKRPAFRPSLEVLEDRCVPSANTLTVTNLYDSGPGSLRYEIAQATSKDNTIVFDKKLGGTITLTSGELVISKSLTIEGDSKVTIESQPWADGAFDTQYGSRIFEVDGAGTTVALSGLTLTGGGGTRLGGGFIGSPNDGYGGAILNFGKLTVSGCTLGGNTRVGVSGLLGNVTQFGGAVANFGTMTLSGCDVSNNRATGPTGAAVAEGGGIYNAGTLTVSGSHVWYNSEGGGIYNTGTAAALTVSNSFFSGNSPDNIFGPYTDGGGNTFK
jgi:hypothetical protein